MQQSRGHGRAAQPRTSSSSLPRRAALGEVHLRPRGVGERVRRADDDPQLAASRRARTGRRRGASSSSAGRSRQCRNQKPVDRARGAHQPARVHRVRRAARDAVGDQAPERRERLSEASKTSPPIASRTTSTGAPPLASSSRSVSPSASVSTAASAPSSSASARFSGERGGRDHAPGARQRARQLDRERAGAAGRRVDDDALPRRDAGARAQQVPRGQPLEQQRERAPSS